MVTGTHRQSVLIGRSKEPILSLPAPSLYLLGKHDLTVLSISFLCSYLYLFYLKSSFAVKIDNLTIWQSTEGFKEHMLP